MSTLQDLNQSQQATALEKIAGSTSTSEWAQAWNLAQSFTFSFTDVTGQTILTKLKNLLLNIGLL